MEKFEIAATSGFLGFLGGLLGTLAKYLFPQKTKTTFEPQPLDVKLAQEYIPRKEYRDDIKQLFDLLRKQEASFSDFRAGFSQQIGNLDGKISTLTEMVRKDKK